MKELTAKLLAGNCKKFVCNTSILVSKKICHMSRIQNYSMLMNPSFLSLRTLKKNKTMVILVDGTDSKIMNCNPRLLTRYLPTVAYIR